MPDLEFIFLTHKHKKTAMKTPQTKPNYSLNGSRANGSTPKLSTPETSAEAMPAPAAEVDESPRDGEVNRPAETGNTPVIAADAALPTQEPVQKPEPAPAAPVVVKSVAERLAEQTSRLQHLNRTASQIAKLEAMKADLDRLTVEDGDERSFAAITLTDDMRREHKFQNAGLVKLAIDWLGQTLTDKLTEKQAELLAVSLT